MVDKNHVALGFFFFFFFSILFDLWAYIVLRDFVWISWPVDICNGNKPHGTNFTNTMTSTRKFAFPFFIQQQDCQLKKKESIKILECQRKEKRLGWMEEHACLVKALGPFVLILSNADFLWVAEVAKIACVCLCVCICVSECICMFI